MHNQDLEQKADSFILKIDNCKSRIELDAIISNYQTIEHPHVGLKIGEMLLIYNQKSEAFRFFKHSAGFGLVNTEKWLETGYANSIGHSYFYLLTQYNYNPHLNDIIYKMYVNCYMSLSVCILNMQIDAYDSFRTRGNLFESTHDSATKLLNKYYYDGFDLCRQILSIGDFFAASLGLKKFGLIQEAQDSLLRAHNAFNIIKHQPNYCEQANIIGFDNYAKSGLDNSKYFINNLLGDYKKGIFNISNTEWVSIEESLKESNIQLSKIKIKSEGRGNFMYRVDDQRWNIWKTLDQGTLDFTNDCYTLTNLNGDTFVASKKGDMSSAKMCNINFDKDNYNFEVFSGLYLNGGTYINDTHFFLYRYKNKDKRNQFIICSAFGINEGSFIHFEVIM